MTKKSVVLLPPEVGFSKYNPSISKVSLSNHRYKAVLHAFCCYCCCCVAKRRMMKNVFVFVSFMLQLLLLCMYVCTIMIIHYYYYYILLFVLQLSPRDDPITEQGPAIARVHKRRPTQASKGHNGVRFSILRHSQRFI